MIVKSVKLKNWKNFLDVDVNLAERTYLLGVNASGKSNFLDVFRFLRDISRSQGGGLQKAINDRGGIKKIRCLHARKDTEIRIEVRLSESADSPESWRYVLAITSEPGGTHRNLISAEEVYHEDKCLLKRPDENDKKDAVRRTQTSLEQIQANADFRELAEYFEKTTYLHLVPQLLRFGDRIGGQLLEGDPFGQCFLERIARIGPKSRDARLKRIEKVLSSILDHFQDLRFIKDEATGRPHLEMKYAHWQKDAGWQREEQFSDGTLRLIALLWILQEGESLLLLEEPELSLNNSIVSEIPLLFQRITRDRKKRSRQILTSTHSEAILQNQGIDPDGVLLLEPAQEGTKIRVANAEERALFQDGFSIAEVMLPRVAPEKINQLALS
jgi:predicted ATPase